MISNQKKGNLDWTKDIFYHKGSEVLEQVGQRRGGCPIPGDMQGQAVSTLI